MEPPGDAAAIADAGAEEKRRGWPRRPRQLQQWPQEGAGAERPPCVYCSQSKVKCVGGLPCERCWVLNLPCRLRQRQRRMPTAKRRKGEDADAAREVLAAATGGPPVAVVLATANVKANAEAYLQAFHKLLSEGQVIRERVVAQLRYYRKMALVVGTDITWGIAETLTAALGITPTELEGPQTLATSPPPLVRKQQAAAILASARMRVEALKQDPAFKAEDDGVTPIYLNTAGEDGCGLFVNNDAFDRVMGRSALEQVELARQRRAAMILLTASTICPEDRPAAFYQGLAVKFTRLERSTAVFKMFINGEVRLFIMHAKRLVADGLPGILVTYEPAPMSRYLTDRPDLPHVVRSFKLYGHGGPAAAASTTPRPGASGPGVTIGAGAVAPVAPSSLPSIVAVPMVPRLPGAVDPPPPLDTQRCHELFGLANPNPKPGAGSGSTSFTSGDCASSSDGGGGSDGCGGSGGSGGSGSGTSDSIADVSLGWEDGVGEEEKETAEVVGGVPILDTEMMKNLFD